MMRTPTRTKRSGGSQLSSQALENLAEKRLKRILGRCQKIEPLRRRVENRGKTKWLVGIHLVGAPKMKALNHRYLKKNFATDVLSFPSPGAFRIMGYLGELVVCFPVLKKQATQHGHPAKKELDVLLVHGVLHLLGMDHEKGGQKAKEMARWEGRLLSEMGGVSASRSGLIVRAHSAKRKT